MRISTENPALSAAQKLEPLSGINRLDGLDALRGLAVLGCTPLLLAFYSYINTKRLGDMGNLTLDGGEGVAWILWYTFFDQSFLFILALVFGASLALSLQQERGKYRQLAAHQRRRLSGFLCLALILCLFFGAPYFLCVLSLAGLVFLNFRSLEKETCYRLGVSFVIVQLILWAAIALIAYLFTIDWISETARRGYSIPGNANLFELNAMLGSLGDQLSWRFSLPYFLGFAFYTAQFLFLYVGFLFLGKALMLSGALEGKYPASKYTTAIFSGAIIGIPLTFIAIMQSVNNQWDPLYVLTVSNLISLFGHLCIAGIYIGLVMLMHRRKWFPLFRYSLISVGRLALTHFLLMCFFLSWGFYGHGWAWAAEVTWGDIARMTSYWWLFQIFASPLWLKYFYFGPAEWLWRMWVYRTRLTMPRLDQLFTH